MIYESDVKLKHRQEDSDFDTGLGPITSRDVADGAIGDLFSPTTELNALEGAVKIRGLGVVVDTPGREIFGGAHVVLTEVPADANISVVMTTTGNEFARRPEVVKALGSLYTMAGVFNGIVYQTQRKNSRYLQIWQSLNAALPKIGQKYAINQDLGTNVEVEQYIQIEKVEFEIIDREDAPGIFQKQLTTLTLSKPLLYDFVGADISRYVPATNTLRAKFYSTAISDSSLYYGYSHLAAPATVGQRTIQVDSVFQQFLPRSLSFDPKLDLTAGGQEGGIVAASSGTTTRTTGAAFGPGITLHIRPWVQGTLVLQMGDTHIVDSVSSGDLLLAGASVGTANNASGELSAASNCPALTGLKSITYQPAGVVDAPVQVSIIDVTASNRGTAYTTTLPRLPLPGSLTVEYIYQEEVYTLRDRGDYYCVGDSAAFGNALFVADNKSLAISLEVFPDISWIIIKYAVKSYTFTRGGQALPGAYFLITADSAIAPGMTVITWNDGIANRTANINNLGQLTGDATGVCYPASKQIKLYPNILPPRGTDFVVTTTPYAVGTETFPTIPIDSGGLAQIPLAHKHVVPGTVSMLFTSALDTYTEQLATSGGTSNSATQAQTAPATTHPIDGNFVFNDNGVNFTGLDAIYGNSVSNDYNGSLVNNAHLTFDPHWQQTVRQSIHQEVLIHTSVIYMYYSPNGFPMQASRDVVSDEFHDVWQTTSHIYQGKSVTISYLYGDPLSQTVQTIPCQSLILDVTPVSSELIVSGSLDFTLGGHRYEDTSGAVYGDVDAATGAGVFAGTLNNQTGKASLVSWASGVANSAYLNALTTRVGLDTVSQTVLSGPGRPIQVGSVQIVATDVGGNNLSATADANGVLLADGINGSFGYSIAQGIVRFGDLIAAAGHEGDPGYNPAAVVDGKWFKARQVLPESIRWNCTLITTNPVDDAAIGFPTDQLPSDGRILWVKKGSLLAVIDTQSITVGAAVAGGTVSMGRDRLERIWVRDSTGVKLPSTAYAVDIDNGSLTWAAPLSLAGYSAPFTIYHRRMHKSLVTDVSIDGTIQLAKAINYDVLPAGCLVSTSLVIGDMQGRVTNYFHEITWSGGWFSSSQTGSPSAQYNFDDYPILVHNSSSKDSYALVIQADGLHFKVISKHRGITQNIPLSSDYTYTNKYTGEDEFTVYAAGFGAGWLSGNAIRFDVQGAKQEVDLALSIQQGAEIGPVQRLTVEVHGGI